MNSTLSSLLIRINLIEQNLKSRKDMKSGSQISKETLNKSRSKNTKKEIDTLYNENGDVVVVEVVKDKTEHSSHFDKMFHNLIYEIENINDGNTSLLLLKLLYEKDYTNKVYMTIQHMSDLIGVNRNITSKCVKNLMKIDFMRIEQKGIYMINPYHHSNGKAKKIETLFEEYISLDNNELF